MLHIRQAREADKPAIEAMYGRRVRYNDAHGIHQWNPDAVSYTHLDVYKRQHNGHINQSIMKRERYNIDDLMSQIRSKDLCTPEDVYKRQAGDSGSHTGKSAVSIPKLSGFFI